MAGYRKRRYIYVGIAAWFNDGDKAFQLCIILSNKQAALKKS